MKLLLIKQDNSILDLSEVTSIPGIITSGLKLISPKKENFTIEEIKEFIHDLRIKKTNINKDLFHIFLQGEKLSQICQNALLKVFEESEYNLGIVVRNVSSLLPTIQSRCIVFDLNKSISPLSNNSNSKLFIDSIDMNNVQSISKLDRGEILRLLENDLLIANPSNFTQYNLISDVYKKIKSNCKIEAVLINYIFANSSPKI